MEHILVADGETYQGRYVTVSGPDSNSVLSSADDPYEAVRLAEEMGYPDAMILYVPSEEEHTFIF